MSAGKVCSYKGKKNTKNAIKLIKLDGRRMFKPDDVKQFT